MWPVQSSVQPLGMRRAVWPGEGGLELPELRKDPITGRWVIISTDRAKRPMDFLRESVGIKGKGVCPFCPGTKARLRRKFSRTDGMAAGRDTPGWRVRVVPNKFPALGIEGGLDREGEGLFDRMNGVGAHEVIIETPDHMQHARHAAAESRSKKCCGLAATGCSI